MKIELTATRPRTFWNDLHSREYGFYSIVNPKKPRPRWSQPSETMLGTQEVHQTQIYNGYAEYVAHVYAGNEH